MEDLSLLKGDLIDVRNRKSQKRSERFRQFQSSSSFCTTVALYGSLHRQPYLQGTILVTFDPLSIVAHSVMLLKQ